MLLSKYSLDINNTVLFNSMFRTSVADPDPGSGAFLPPGSGIRDEFLPDPGSGSFSYNTGTGIFRIHVTLSL
jgi:hypothetical protein